MLLKDKDSWKKIIQSGEGFIYNDFGTQSEWNPPIFNKLHKASCSRVSQMTYISDGKLTKHFFKSLKESIDWLEKNRKTDGYSLCKYCCPNNQD